MARPVSPVTARKALLAWYDRGHRAMPWRGSRDPYAIWVSEIMLQQTRVETVVPFYERFLRRFPTVRALAEAPIADVLAAWSGLGYYRRARMLHAGAQAVCDTHGGEIPRDPVALRALPGVGPYTAGAIASIAFDLPEPIVDGNVERVLTRWRAMEGDPRARENKAAVWSLARAFAEGPRPGDVNQSLMELGATVCLPRAPQCLVCPLRSGCAAHALGTPERFPELRARAPVREESWHALVATSGGRVWLVPSAMGRWTGMLVPLLVEGGDVAAARRVFRGRGAREVREVGRVVHVLTHAAMRVTVHAGVVESVSEGVLVADADLDTHAVPKLTRVVLAAAGFGATSAAAKARPASRTPRGSAR